MFSLKRGVWGKILPTHFEMLGDVEGAAAFNKSNCKGQRNQIYIQFKSA